VPKNQRDRIIENTRILLRNRRIELGLSMNRTGELAGLSQQTISYVERGLRDPTLATLLRICGALEIDLSEILKNAEKSQQQSVEGKTTTS
jgi:transcriptional regulator with XRE-family HTH domain